MKNSAELLKEVRSSMRWASAALFLGGLWLAVDKWIGVASPAEVKEGGALWLAFGLALLFGLWFVNCTEAIVAAIKEQKA